MGGVGSKRGGGASFAVEDSRGLNGFYEDINTANKLAPCYRHEGSQLFFILLTQSDWLNDFNFRVRAQVGVKRVRLNEDDKVDPSVMKNVGRDSCKVLQYRQFCAVLKRMQSEAEVAMQIQMTLRGWVEPKRISVQRVLMADGRIVPVDEARAAAAAAAADCSADACGDCGTPAAGMPSDSPAALSRCQTEDVSAAAGCGSGGRGPAVPKESPVSVVTAAMEARMAQLAAAAAAAEGEEGEGLQVEVAPAGGDVDESVTPPGRRDGASVGVEESTKDMSVGRRHGVDGAEYQGFGDFGDRPEDAEEAGDAGPAGAHREPEPADGDDASAPGVVGAARPPPSADSDAASATMPEAAAAAAGEHTNIARGYDGSGRCVSGGGGGARENGAVAEERRVIRAPRPEYECMICLEMTSSGISLPCFHGPFCEGCISVWSRQNRSCPACRMRTGYDDDNCWVLLEEPSLHELVESLYNFIRKL